VKCSLSEIVSCPKFVYKIHNLELTFFSHFFDNSPGKIKILSTQNFTLFEIEFENVLCKQYATFCLSYFFLKNHAQRRCS